MCSVLREMSVIETASQGLTAEHLTENPTGCLNVLDTQNFFNLPVRMGPDGNLK